MTMSDVAILAGGLVLTGLLGWYFFGPKKSLQAELSDGVQVVKVTVKGGYSPPPAGGGAGRGRGRRRHQRRSPQGDCSVCGTAVDPATAAANVAHQGHTFHSCGTGCAKSFRENPDRYSNLVKG